MKRLARQRIPLLSLLLAAYWCAACAVPLGPGYSIERQQIDVHFMPAPVPAIHISATYQLRNTGNQRLTLLELRLPGRRRFHFTDAHADWDGYVLPIEPSPSNPRNTLLKFPSPWHVAGKHNLRLSVVYLPPEANEEALSFSATAFFLPAEGWSPELLPARGLLAKGGVPPKTWDLVIRVPEDFLVHASGAPNQRKSSRSGGELIIRALQRPSDGYPSVVAGRFKTTPLNTGGENVFLWTHAAQNPNELREPSAALSRAIRAYEGMFGMRSKSVGKGGNELWLVECPVVRGCFTGGSSNYAQLVLGGGTDSGAEMASADTVMLDLSGGLPQIATAAAPSLAASWLGYGENPGFFEQTPPLSALPAFAAFRAKEAVEGSAARAQTVRQLLQKVPAADAARTEQDTALRAKSVLFFYGLQDRYGEKVFDDALRHMLDARRGGGFDLDDLISAFEQEAHQNVAQFVRLWMKHPGVPAEFRARYEETSTALLTSKETR